MKTAVITGASSGLGRELARQIEDVFPDIACYWLIARREERLQALAGELGIGTITLPDMVKELEKPARDPRDEMPKPILRTDVL